ncbi:MAG: ATP-binding protein [Candidatus Obscuribacterales bacterium]|nr:ATP-binding protein [Candidatus Obscuribacterales bacterium]
MSEATFQLTQGIQEAAMANRAKRLSIAAFDFNEQPLFDRETFIRLADGELVETGGNAVLFGGPGTGKSHLTYALAGNAVQKGKTVRVINGETPSDSLNRLLEPYNLADLTREVSQPYTGPRLDLLHCDLLIVSDLPRNKDEGATLANILLQRFEQKRSTVITTTLGASAIIRSDVFDRATVRDRVAERTSLAVSNYTELVFLKLNIGVPVRGDHAIRDRITVATAAQSELFKRFDVVPFCAVRCPVAQKEFEETLGTGEPRQLRPWNLFVLGQRSYRFHPKFWMRRGIKQSNWPPEAVSWLAELGPSYQPPDEE